MAKTTRPRTSKSARSASAAGAKRKKPPSVVTPRDLEAEYRPVDENDENSSDAQENDRGEGVDGIDEPNEPNEGEWSSESSAATLPATSTGFDAQAEEGAQETGLVHHHDILKRYLNDVSRYALLTPEEEFALAVKLKQTGDIEAARRLVSANLRLVVKIAMEYRSAYQNVMDLIQEGNVGLMKAVSKFDPSKGAKLSYYASWWIRSYILKYILDNFRLVRVGTTQAQKKLFFHLMREKERLEAQGFHVGPKLLADRLHVREQDVVEMEQRLSGRGAEMSLNAPVGTGEEESTATHMDLLADPNTSPDEAIEQSELKQILSSKLDDFAKTLKEKEFAVFKERLAADQPKTLQEVADKFGLTRERARQIEVRVIEKLREYYKKYIR